MEEEDTVVQWSIIPEVAEATVGTTNIPAHFVAKEQSSYNDSEKEKIDMDGCLQLVR